MNSLATGKLPPDLLASLLVRVVPASEGLTLVNGIARRPLPQFAVDEITRLFG